MKSKIQELNDKFADQVIGYYQHLHAHPELSFIEHKTAEFIVSELKKNNISYQDKIAGTGILARIEGRNPNKRVIALRADMDALPICEITDVPYKSTNSKVMHACGHDAHTSCLLGVAMMLNEIKSSFEGTILFVFQPGEEKAPGGARLMLEDGVFSDVRPDLIIAQHVSVDYPTGTMGFKEGMIMASADEVHVKVMGKGGHGALPHLCNDTVLAASATVVALQQVRSRLCHPLTPMVLTFGRIVADGAQNIIPHEVQLSGTFRTIDENWRQDAKRHIRRIINETCEAYSCTAEILMPDGFPCVINHGIITNRAKDYAQEWVGKDQVVELEMRMTSEDFGFFTQQYPSCFYRFGIKGASNQDTGGLHSANFKVDLDALKIGTGGLAWLAWRFMTDND